MFGERKDAYSVDTLRNLISKGKIEKAKEYVLDYFARVSNPPGVLSWVPSERKTEHLKDADAKNLFIKRFKNGDFDIQKWFFIDHSTVYRQNIDAHKKKIYIKDKQQYINIFEGYRFTEKKKYSSFDKETKKKVEAIWNHIFIVWASRKEAQYNYIKQWICNVFCGIKMKTCIYLKGNQGTGKSIVTEFIQSVLGMNAVHITSDPDVILGKFNSQIASKILLVLEEMPCSTATSWMSLSNSLKNIVTGKTINIKTKHKDEYETENIVSVIVISNNNALKLDVDDRRNLVGDISKEMVGNDDYFDELIKIVDDEKVQEAFYWYCKEHGDPNFQEKLIPRTEAKKEMIIENLHPVAKYLKYFLTQRISIEEPFPEFYDGFKRYCSENKINQTLSNQKVGRFIEDLGFEIKNESKNRRIVRIHYKDLLRVFSEKDWIGEFDGIEQKTSKRIEYEELKEMYYEDLKERKNFYKRVDDFLNNYEKRKQKKVIIVDSDYESEDEISKVVNLLK